MSTHALNTDAILAAIFDPQLTPADLPAKTGLSLPQLARWLKANAETVNEVREFLVQRATFIGARLHTASLGALDRVIRECPDLERVRKAASTILRSLKLATSPPSPRSGGENSLGEAKGNRGGPQPIAASVHTNGTCDLVVACDTKTLSTHASLKRPSPAERLAAMRLAKLIERPMAPAT